ncbi:hypothetical protein [Nocardia sp. NPDC127526]|uniref:hypothetical protein n=1 Tax=Nocardia sp. NPDC127526 TaxID=3345393 RepID=UPI00362E5686
MTAPGQVFTARLPTPPTAVPAVPAASTIIVDAPQPARTSIDGTRIPVVPPFVYAAFSGSTQNTPIFKPSATATAGLSGLGTLTTAIAYTKQWSTPAFGNEGTATAGVSVGAGGQVVVTASFGGDSYTVAGNAAFSGVAGLSASVVPYLSAAAAFGTIGTSMSTNVGPIPATAIGVGTLSAAVAPAFRPSGMTKNGDQSLTGDWTDIYGWIADTGSFPGSTINGNGLVVQGTELKAVISATVPYVIASGFGGPRQAVRLLVNGEEVAKSQEVSGWSGTMTATASLRVNAGDRVTIQGWSSHNAAVRNGTGTWVRIQRAQP